MQTINYALFPTLVQELIDFLSNSECNLLIDSINKSQLHSHCSLDGQATSTYSFNSKELERFESVVPLKAKLLKVLNEHATIAGLGNLKIDNSWVNIQNPFSTLKFHTHPLSVISGVLYLKVNQQSSPITFKNPNPFLSIMNYNNITDFTCEYYSFKPKCGSLLLFPSWLQHGSFEKNQSEERIVLSLNAIPN